MAHDLEAPNGDSTDWDVLYLARGAGEVVAHRPFFTGDVFTGVTVQPPRAEPKTKTVMIIQHPCAMRPTGVELDTSILVAEVRRFAVLPPERWNTNGKLIPLPDVLPEVTSGRRHQAALFDNTFHVHPDDLTDRIVCLSLRGVNLLLQRWVYHSSRVVVPSFDLNTAVSPVYEEADLVEEWCESATETGRSVAEAQRDADAWLQEEPSNGVSRRKTLENPQGRSMIRRSARTAAATWRPPQVSEPGIISPTGTEV